jgi:hypothetical protein
MVIRADNATRKSCCGVCPLFAAHCLLQVEQHMQSDMSNRSYQVEDASMHAGMTSSQSCLPIKWTWSGPFKIECMIVKRAMMS